MSADEIKGIKPSADPGRDRQRDRLSSLLRRQRVARLAEIRQAGITATTVSRLVREGVVSRLGRGLYQMADAVPGTRQVLAEAAKRVPRGVICLVSALAFHDLTDQMPRRVWVAIGPKDWKPTVDDPPLRIVRFAERFLHDGVEIHEIDGVTVPIFGVAKTVVDVFRRQQSVGTDVAVLAMKEALRQRKTSAAQIADAAARSGAWNAIRPYLEALTADG